MDWRFRALVAAHAVSAYGNYLNLIALSLFSYEVTGTAFGVGVVMALRLLSGVVAGLTAGALSTRVTRRTVMVGTDVAQAAAMTVLALCAARTPLWLLLGAVVVLGAGNTFFTVALRSAFPVMVGQEDRGRANGVLVTARSFATVLGFVSAAPIIGFGGHAAAFAVNAASFVVSAVAVLVLRPHTDDAVSDVQGDTDTQSDGRGSDGHPPGPPRGARRLRPRVAGVSGLVLGMIMLRGVDALASSSHNVALPVVAHVSAPSDPAVFMTRFWVAWAVGTLLAHQVLKRRRGKAVGGEHLFAAGTCVMSLCFVTAFTGLPAAALMAAAMAAGFADGCTEIVYTSRLQEAPDRQRGRLFGLSATAETTGFALGTVAAAVALEALPALAVVAAFHGAALCGAVLLLLFTTVRGDTGARSSTRENERGDTHGTRTGAGPLQGS